MAESCNDRRDVPLAWEPPKGIITCQIVIERNRIGHLSYILGERVGGGSEGHVFLCVCVARFSFLLSLALSEFRLKWLSIPFDVTLIFQIGCFGQVFDNLRPVCSFLPLADRSWTGLIP